MFQSELKHPFDFFTDNKADVFKCSWGNIPIFLQCDGTNNCGDNSDEEDCNKGKGSSINNIGPCLWLDYP